MIKTTRLSDARPAMTTRYDPVKFGYDAYFEAVVYVSSSSIFLLYLLGLLYLIIVCVPRTELLVPCYVCIYLEHAVW